MLFEFPNTNFFQVNFRSLSIVDGVNIIRWAFTNYNKCRIRRSSLRFLILFYLRFQML